MQNHISSLREDQYFNGPADPDDTICDHCSGDGFICVNCEEGENSCTCGVVDKKDGTKICDYCFGEG